MKEQKLRVTEVASTKVPDLRRIAFVLRRLEGRIGGHTQLSLAAAIGISAQYLNDKVVIYRVPEHRDERTT